MKNKIINILIKNLFIVWIIFWSFSWLYIWTLIINKKIEEQPKKITYKFIKDFERENNLVVVDVIYNWCNDVNLDIGIYAETQKFPMNDNLCLIAMPDYNNLYK